VYNELIANYRNIMSFRDYYDKLINQCVPINFDQPNSVDIVLSNSVFEHIPSAEIQEMSDKLYRITKPGGRFLHCVDFGPHGDSAAGFGPLYTIEHGANYGRINRLRKSEVEAVLKNSGFNIIRSIVYRTLEVDRSKIHKSWQNYSDDDLSSYVVIIIGEKEIAVSN
jgi:ubiquinone/menaquinone biosynthesis C-methylase UbiE